MPTGVRMFVPLRLDRIGLSVMLTLQLNLLYRRVPFSFASQG